MQLSREELLSIDFSEFDRLIRYSQPDAANPIDWALNRRKILFLQSAVRLGVDFAEAVERTYPAFGPTLRPPFEAEVVAPDIDAFEPPLFDLARQTLSDWGRVTDQAYKVWRDDKISQAAQQISELIKEGRLTETPETRRDSGIQGKQNSQIAPECVRYEWAVKRFFFQTSWPELETQYPPNRQLPSDPVERARAVRNRQSQIRRQARVLLASLGLRQ